VTIYLADTQIVLWAGAAPHRLGEQVRGILTDPTIDVVVSAVSVAEMAIKRSIGKLSLPVGPLEFCRTLGFRLVPLEAEQADRAGELPLRHRDPFDRLLIAQAAALDATLISADRAFADYADHVTLLANA
jgi:PIN domain nuclease of toxin-antitoxin system